MQNRLLGETESKIPGYQSRAITRLFSSSERDINALLADLERRCRRSLKKHGCRLEQLHRITMGLPLAEELPA